MSSKKGTDEKENEEKRLLQEEQERKQAELEYQQRILAKQQRAAARAQRGNYQRRRGQQTANNSLNKRNRARAKIELMRKRSIKQRHEKTQKFVKTQRPIRLHRLPPLRILESESMILSYAIYFRDKVSLPRLRNLCTLTINAYMYLHTYTHTHD